MSTFFDNQACNALEDIEVKDGTYFVTGATGFIGRYIVLSLLHICRHDKARVKVIAAVRDKKKAEEIYRAYLQESYFEIMEQDMTEPYHFDENIDYLIHAAVRKQTVDNDSFSVFHDNMLATKEILCFAQEKKVRKILLISTCSVYGDLLLQGITDECHLGGNDSMNAKLCYAESKRASEYMFACGLEQMSLCGSIVRLFSVYGPGMDFASPNVFADLFRQAMIGEKIKINGSGQGVRNFSYIRDVIYGIFTVLYAGENGEAYNVGSKNADISILGLAEKLGEKTGRRLEIEAGRLSPNGRETIQAARMERIGSIAKQPATSIEEGLEKMISFYSNYVLLQKVIDEMDSL